jgi:pyruvate-formate lyase-activating enzyme
LIPKVTDTDENIRGICRLLNKHGVDSVEVLSYNTMAGGKYKMLLREYRPLFDETVPVKLNKELFESFGIKAIYL